MEIRDDKEHGVVTIDGRTIEGWLDHEPCKLCSQTRVYHEKYDAYFCPRCNAWLEGRCSDPDCQFCPARPERPLG